MNILYLHGLESKLSDEKKAILKTYGTVIAPDLNYNSNPNTIQNLYDEYKNQEINVIIGSSMGGVQVFIWQMALVFALYYTILPCPTETMSCKTFLLIFPKNNLRWCVLFLVVGMM